MQEDGAEVSASGVQHYCSCGPPPQPAPQQAVMPGMLITVSPALLSCNWSGHLVIPHLPTTEALAVLAVEPDLLGRRQQHAGEAMEGGCSC